MLFSNRIEGNFSQFGLHCSIDSREICVQSSKLVCKRLESEGRVLPKAAIFRKVCEALIFLDQYVFILVGALGTLLQSNPNFRMTTDPSENPHAGNGIDTAITPIVKAKISGYYATRLKGNKRSHAQASASIIFRLSSEPHQIRETCERLAAFVCERNVQPRF